jgi:hypothetical protein
MIVIDNTIVSDDLWKVQFICNVDRCLGACCVAGDAGAPLQEEEISVLEDNLEKIRPYMTEKGRETVRELGLFDYDMKGDFVTPLVNGAECAFTNFEKGIAYCAVERAWEEGKITFRKPVSCHLYPVRISKFNEFDAVNYDKWHICKPALKLGRKKGVPLYVFLKASLNRKYGAEWYDKLVKAIDELKDK